MENTQWKNELLMENLRAKSTKSMAELAKNFRLNLLERRYNIDAVEKQILQTALSKLQSNIQIKNRGHLVERLESITRSRELKFTDNANTNSIFISSDMFYLEILLDQSGEVNDVKIHHECENESESNSYLIDVLKKGDFSDFTQQLAGFQSIYQLNAESKIKSKAFIAIRALEADLTSIFNNEASTSSSYEELLVSSSVGILTPRRGGKPMELLFFVRLSELLNFEQKKMDSLKNALQNALAEKKSIGNSVTINLETAAPNKLQISPLLLKNGKLDGNFSYVQINANNSTMLPAAFVLRLNKAMPILSQFVDEFKKISNNLGVFGDVKNVKLESQCMNSPTSLIKLIIKQESEETYESGQKGLFVTLEDQLHCYFLSDNPELTGLNVKSIQFTEPLHVTQIIKLLRQQAIFNALISSCVRKQNNCQEFDFPSYIFEVNVVSLQLIQIFVEHEESIVTVEFDLSDIKQPNCRINENDQQCDFNLDNYILRVFHETMSIPMVLRSLIRYWESLHSKLYNNGIFGSIPDSRKDTDRKNDDSEHGDRRDSPSPYTRQDSNTYGVNKEDFFFKTNDYKVEKRFNHDLDTNSENYNHRNNFSRVMSLDLDRETDGAMFTKTLTEDLTNESSYSPNCGVFNGGMLREGAIAPLKSMQKSMDIFEFNDPSPPSTAMIQSKSPLTEERMRKISTPRVSPSSSSTDRKIGDSEMTSLKSDNSALISTTSVNKSSNFVFEKLKSEKKKKRKREESEEGPSLARKKLSESVSPSKKSSGSALIGKPSASFKPGKLPLTGGEIESMEDLSFLSYGVEQQINTIPSSLLSPQNMSKNTSPVNRKNSLSAVINKLKSEIVSGPSSQEKKGEYQIKSSGNDGIKITFNKTKSSKGGNKHTGTNSGLKPGTNSGPASKKTSHSSKNSSHKLLFQKSSSSGSLHTAKSTIPSPKSTSQPGYSSLKDKPKEGRISPFPSFATNPNIMLKTMLNLTSPTPDMKSFDKNFQIPKLSARGKSDEKADDVKSLYPRSAPSPVQFSTPVSADSSIFQKGFPNLFETAQPKNNFNDHLGENRDLKLFKSASSEQLFSAPERSGLNKTIPSCEMDDFHAFLRAQTKQKNSSMSIDKIGTIENHAQSGSQESSSSSVLRPGDFMDLSFIGNEI